MKRWRDSLGPNFFAGGMLAVFLLVSAFEDGSAGSWAMWCAGGIVLMMAGMVSYASWREREVRRRQERKREKLSKKIMEQTEKKFYLRDAAA